MIAEFRTATGDIIPLPATATLNVAYYDAEAVGGYKSAEMTVTGPTSALWQPVRWLGYRVTIRDNDYNAVWYGMLHEVVVSTGTLEIGMSLAGMYNRVAVAYTTEAPGGSLERFTTDWAENADSVARYGYKELLYSLSDATAARAEAQRDTLLATFGNPQPMLRIASADTPMATLRCIGLYDTLDWRYYANSAGKEEHMDGGQMHPLGQGFTASTIGFTADGRIHDTGNRLDELISDLNVQVTGSTSNNGTHLIDGSGNDGESYTAATIFFEPSDDVKDSAQGLSFLSADDIIIISGSADNDGTMRVKTAASDTITVTQTMILNSAGPSVTIAQAGSVSTTTTFTNELPSASVTITVHGQKVAQAFGLAASGSWTVDKVEVKLAKVGAPADSVTVQLCSDSAGLPSSVLASATVDAADIGESSDWIEFDLGNTQTITYGTVYWLVLSRTGSNDIDDYYTVDVDEDTGYSRGYLKVWTGSAWVNRATEADMTFRVLGAVETTEQVNQIYSAIGQFFTDIDIYSDSGVYSNQFREGDNTAKTEIDNLLSSGSDTSRRMLASVTTDGVLKIFVQPTITEDDLMLRSDGTVGWQAGSRINEGWLPVAQWLKLADIPTNVDALAPLVNVFIERAEFRDGGLVVEPQGMPSPWDTGKI